MSEHSLACFSCWQEIWLSTFRLFVFLFFCFVFVVDFLFFVWSISFFPPVPCQQKMRYRNQWSNQSLKLDYDHPIRTFRWHERNMSINKKGRTAYGPSLSDLNWIVLIKTMTINKIRVIIIIFPKRKIVSIETSSNYTLLLSVGCFIMNIGL